MAKKIKKTSKKNKVSAKKSLKSAPQKKAAIQPKTKKLAALKSAPIKPAAKTVKAEIVDTTRALKTSNELTPLSTDALTAYLANVNKYPLLTREQELEIAERYFKQKNPKDAEILVTSNLRFVVKIAAEYARFGNRLIDIVQEGNVGLMHAVKEFNPYKGVRLISYAVWWIRGYIQEYLMRQHSVVRIGTTQNQRKLFYHLEKEKKNLDQLGNEPDVKMLSARLGVPESDVKMMEERMFGRDISLDQPVGDDGNAIRLDLESTDEISVDDEMVRRESLKVLEKNLVELRPKLNDKEILLLDERLLADNPVTLQDIGEKWGVTREAVRQMEARLMKKIKDAVSATLKG